MQKPIIPKIGEHEGINRMESPHYLIAFQILGVGIKQKNYFSQVENADLLALYVHFEGGIKSYSCNRLNNDQYLVFTAKNN